MPDYIKLAPHETIQLRELLTSSVLGAKKLKSSISLVDDEELKSFMENSLNAKKASIEAMTNLINNVVVE